MSDADWKDGLPENNHAGGVWVSARYTCPECGADAFENPFHAWCDECNVYRKTGAVTGG